jgi:mannose-6-phosphate isomerase-like protein (cupin superfamily)
MSLKNLKDCREITAGDGSILRELLHPGKADLQINYSLAHAKVEVGRKTKPHKLRTCEVYYIISGRGMMHIDEKSFQVEPDCTVYIPPNSTQYIENTGKSVLKFLCIVDPPWQKEDEEVFNY